MNLFGGESGLTPQEHAFFSGKSEFGWQHGQDEQEIAERARREALAAARTRMERGMTKADSKNLDELTLGMSIAEQEFFYSEPDFSREIFAETNQQEAEGEGTRSLAQIEQDISRELSQLETIKRMLIASHQPTDRSYVEAKKFLIDPGYQNHARLYFKLRHEMVRKLKANSKKNIPAQEEAVQPQL